MMKYLIYFFVSMYLVFFNYEFKMRFLKDYFKQEIFFDQSINVIARDNFDKITINVGGLSDVENGDILMSNGYLLGMVTDVKKFKSIVTLITDKYNKVSIKIGNNYGLISNYEDGYLIIKNIKKDVEVGSKVVTTGINYVYPSDIFVGIVAKILEENDIQKIYVKTDADFDNMSNLSLIKR